MRGPGFAAGKACIHMALPGEGRTWSVRGMKLWVTLSKVLFIHTASIPVI